MERRSEAKSTSWNCRSTLHYSRLKIGNKDERGKQRIHNWHLRAHERTQPAETNTERETTEQQRVPAFGHLEQMHEDRLRWPPTTDMDFFTWTYIYLNFILYEAQLNNCIDWILWRYINRNYCYYYVCSGSCGGFFQRRRLSPLWSNGATRGYSRYRRMSWRRHSQRMSTCCALRRQNVRTDRLWNPGGRVGPMPVSCSVLSTRTTRDHPTNLEDLSEH